MEVYWTHRRLDFKFLAKTSRNAMTTRDTWLLAVVDPVTHNFGIGEAAYFDGLSEESYDDFMAEIHRVCAEGDVSSRVSAVRCGLETAIRNLMPTEENAFTRGEQGIPINGLIWMGDKAEMTKRIDEKISSGFSVLKLKIGGIDFEDELELLRHIRSRYNPEALELRLDANGGFSAGNALEKLKRLSEFGIHSIEQPLKAGDWEHTSALCQSSPIPIALDEELIGMRSRSAKSVLLDTLQPQYIILKPTLCGGLSEADEWIELARERNIGYWATSALESNVGLQALSLWAFSHCSGGNAGAMMPQGLGTGMLYRNNFPSSLELRGNKIFYNPEKKFKLPQMEWHR